MGQSQDGWGLILQGLGVLEGYQTHPWLELQGLEWP